MRLLAFAAFLLVAAAAAPAARLENDGFEMGNFNAWQIDAEGWRCSTFFRDSYRGVYAAVNDVWTNGVDEFRVIHQEIKVSAGKTYMAGVWLRAVCVEGTESFLEIQFLNKEGNVLQQHQSEHVTKDQEFRFMAVTNMVAPEGTEKVSVRGVVHLITPPMDNIDYHIFDNFDFRTVAGTGAGKKP